MKYLFTVVLLLILSACTTGLPLHKSSPSHFYEYQWLLPDDPEHAITTDQVSDKLQDYDVIFFGELHNHPGIHLAQMELFARLYSQNAEISLSMEQFERDTQSLIDQYMAGHIGEEHLINKARAWPNYRSSYRPLIEFAREQKLPVIAANAPKQMVVCVGRSGLEVLEKYSPEERRHIAQQVDISDGPYRKKFLAFMGKDSPHKSHGGHGGKDSQKIMKAMSQRSYAAQMVRDDTMAESIANHLQKNPGRYVLHLNGNFHSSAFLGTVERLQKRMPHLKIAVIHALDNKDNTANNTSQPVGTILIKAHPIPKMFVKSSNRDQWMRKMMEKRMESRKKCPE